MKQSITTITLHDHKIFLALAIPLIISFISTPLLGVVDTAIMGRFPQAAYIGGVSIAVLIFNTLYWVLGFLRVSTAGFSAQAFGLGDKQAIALSLVRPTVIALCLGILIVVCQWPIKAVAFILLAPNETIGSLASTYYNIRIWGAPFVLINYVINGWLMGVAKVKLSLFLQVLMNLLNILFAVILVVGFGLNADGVAAATLIAEFATACIGVMMIRKMQMVSFSGLSLLKFFNPATFIDMMKVNRDLFIRTICLLTVYNLIAVYGIRYGDTILAVNAVLMQVHFVMANLLGGIANASTVFVGQAIGEKNQELYFKTIKLTAIWSGLTAVLLAISVILFQEPLIHLFTTITDIQQVAKSYIYWIALFPLVAFWGLQLYGIFVGATVAVPIRNSMIYSLIFFFACLWVGVPKLANHGVWLAFTVFSLGRSLFLWIYLPNLNGHVLKLDTDTSS
ncbi:MATE family efflux transporter [Pelosinus sp. sgz500959]|uniref:MATE family efflux transporter n=1 Tax=Pelosinus sp. sgz500959 TaxID=3242472 RepID=UPI003671EFCB